MLYAVTHTSRHRESLPPSWRILGMNSLLPWNFIPDWGKDPGGKRPGTCPGELGGAESGCVCRWENGRWGLGVAIFEILLGF